MTVAQFKTDLEKAQEVELYICDALNNLPSIYRFEWVGADAQCYHKGDIKATRYDGKEIYLEIKCDSRIHETYNVLCEENVLYYETYTTTIGNMYSDYEIYCVYSPISHVLYFIDFKVMKDIYKRLGEWKILKHSQQESEVYLLSIGFIKKNGGLLYKLNL